ncbi:dethiobiotin synthase [Humisphaera borealis]|uniref:ATP-dependent dethiobiotin synthetase BioD n=1 Tax=Humisphaera borealis TaxID=2807512 RepID=A0A7M2X3I7_9BACT|nr:dethiobiotin synthase [Humisphaera borealis]QOV91330.1 dethiobiotin synthase [Humisphaera borealis]
MLARVPIPSIFVTGTDTGVGKTVIAGAIADWFRRRGSRVAVLKPAATGCVHRREGLVSEDAEFLAACADARFPLDLICPQRYEEPLAPAVAAERAKQPLDWDAIDRSIRLMSRESDVMIVEGVGGVMVPMDAKHTVLDMAVWLGAPAVIVARPHLGTINHTLLTAEALRSRSVKIAGVVINQYRTDGASVAEETNGRAIEKWGKLSILATVPAGRASAGDLSPDIVAAVEPVDWEALARNRAS